MHNTLIVREQRATELSCKGDVLRIVSAQVRFEGDPKGRIAGDSVLPSGDCFVRACADADASPGRE